MEAKLENILDTMMQNENTIGVLVSDSQGLSYGSKYKKIKMNLKSLS